MNGGLIAHAKQDKKAEQPTCKNDSLIRLANATFTDKSHANNRVIVLSARGFTYSRGSANLATKNLFQQKISSSCFREH